MKILALDLDTRQCGLAYRNGQQLWTTLLSPSLQDEPLDRMRALRHAILGYTCHFSPDLVVIEDYIADFNTKTTTIQKAALHTLVRVGFRDLETDKQLYFRVLPLPAVWLRSYIHPHRYQGKEQNLEFGRRRNFPADLLMQNQRSKQAFKPLLREHELDAAIWTTVLDEIISYLRDERELAPHERTIALKIKERLGPWLPLLTLLKN